MNTCTNARMHSQAHAFAHADILLVRACACYPRQTARPEKHKNRNSLECPFCEGPYTDRQAHTHIQAHTHRQIHALIPHFSPPSKCPAAQKSCLWHKPLFVQCHPTDFSGPVALGRQATHCQLLHNPVSTLVQGKSMIPDAPVPHIVITLVNQSCIGHTLLTASWSNIQSRPKVD